MDVYLLVLSGFVSRQIYAKTAIVKRDID
jgi:hypothetical protein